MEHPAKYLVLVALGVPLATYLWAALGTRRDKVANAAGYFIAYRQVGASPYANSSLAYAFQVATLFPFLYWGLNGLILPAILNAVSWGVGIWLFRRYLRPILSRLNDGDEPKTLHGLLGSWFNSRSVQTVAAVVTMLGMLGVVLAEAYWGMQVLKVLVPEDSPPFYALMFGSILFVLLYIWNGGAWGSIKTDQLQLVFSYIGFTVVFAFSIMTFAYSAMAPRPETAVVSALMVAGGISAIIARLRNRIKPVAPMATTEEQGDESPGWPGLSRWLSILTFAAIALLVVCFIGMLFRSASAATTAPLKDLGDVGPIGIAALMVMGLLFQFVDMSAWQRLQSIGGTSTERMASARRGLTVFAIESPFSWILCLALGTLVAMTLPELATATDQAGPLASYPRVLIESGSALRIVVATSFMVAVMGVMLSTIDSALLAAMYAFVADMRGCKFRAPISTGPGEPQPTGEDMASDRRDLLFGKLAAYFGVVVVCALVVFVGLVFKRPQQGIGFLVGFYGAMLSLFPAVAAMLRGFRGWSAGAVVTGISLGVASVLVLTIWGWWTPAMAWAGVLAGPSVALVATVVTSLILPKRESAR